MRLTPTDTPWHNSLAERHGRVLGEIVEGSVEACQIEGCDEMKFVTIFAARSRGSLGPKTVGQEQLSITSWKEKIPQSYIEQFQMLGSSERLISEPQRR